LYHIYAATEALMAGRGAGRSCAIPTVDVFGIDGRHLAEAARPSLFSQNPDYNLRLFL
jgi:hypothetical protein